MSYLTERSHRDSNADSLRGGQISNLLRYHYSIAANTRRLKQCPTFRRSIQLMADGMGIEPIKVVNQHLQYASLVPAGGIEPPSSGFSDQCSDLVSYTGKTGGAGIEPISWVLETLVLPLNYRPKYIKPFRRMALLLVAPRHTI